jgi:hypothetical protein
LEGRKEMAPKSSNITDQENVLEILDKVAETGVPLEIQRKGKRLIVSPVEKRGKIDRLEPHPEFIVGNPDDLVKMDWSSEWKHEL